MAGRVGSSSPQVYDNSALLLYSDGRVALYNRDIAALDTLYLSSSKQLWSFLKLEHIQPYFSSEVGKNEKDLQVLQWLFEKGGAEIPAPLFESLFERLAAQGKKHLPILQWLFQVAGDKIPRYRCEMAFNAAANLDMEESLPLMQFLLDKVQSCPKALLDAANKGQKGLPMLKWLLENAKEKVAGFGTIGNVFNSAAFDPDGGIVMQLLLDKAKDYLHSTHFEKAFQSALYQGQKGFPILKMIWESTPDKAGDSFREYVISFHRKASEEPEIFAMADWLLERLFLQLGTPCHASDAAWFYIKPDIAALVGPHWKKNGYEWEKGPVEVAEDWIYSNRPYTSLFAQANPQGLPFFERVCKEMPDKISSYGMRWGFLKAAANGKQGHSLMQWLIEKAPEKLSHWTYQRAAHIAEKYGYAETAQWIQSLMSAETPLDEDDIKLLLASSHQPSGYRPLGDIPQRNGWKKLDQEELDKMAPDAAFEGMEIEDPFAGAVICEDAALFRKFYARIKMGHARIIVRGDEEFTKKVYRDIREMMGCPSGRWALLFANRMKNPKPLVICSDSSSQYWVAIHTILLNYYEQGHELTLDENGKKTHYQPTKDSTLFHEMLHAIHEDENAPLTKTLSKMPPSDPNYSNLEEQRTIAPVETGLEHLGPFALSQNTYQFEKGGVKRYGHQV